MQLHDKDYFFCYFRTPPVAFDKLLRIVGRHSSIWGCAPEFSNFIKNLHLTQFRHIFQGFCLFARKIYCKEYL